MRHFWQEYSVQRRWYADHLSPVHTYIPYIEEDSIHTSRESERSEKNGFYHMLKRELSYVGLPFVMPWNTNEKWKVFYWSSELHTLTQDVSIYLKKHSIRPLDDGHAVSYSVSFLIQLVKKITFGWGYKGTLSSIWTKLREAKRKWPIRSHKSLFDLSKPFCRWSSLCSRGLPYIGRLVPYIFWYFSPRIGFIRTSFLSIAEISSGPELVQAAIHLSHVKFINIIIFHCNRIGWSIRMSYSAPYSV